MFKNVQSNRQVAAEPSPATQKATPNPAERMRLLRMRLLRARRRNGLRCAIVMPHETEIDRLMEKGFLQSQRRHDHVAIENAIGVFICYALGEPRGNPHLLAVRTAVNAS